MKDMSVKVAVRVRPFNKREIGLGCTNVVEMIDPSTILKPYQGQVERKFTFDYSFWSFDEFQQDANKYLKPKTSKYADQQSVFNKIGTKILDNAWEGYHCCLFAYGQTGSGKSYSMIGFGPNKGIVPITCNQIFERTKKGTGQIQFQVSVSMLEIYNQQIQDLLIDISKRPAGGLKIRENKLLGVYVEGTSKTLVNSYIQIQNVMEEGTKNRTVAATQMNATSSRAHTIITIQFKQVNKTSKTQKLSIINLVDLAGSERQDKTQATGQRLKEAVGINLSLTSLGQVISTLAENANGANKFVPYRNSSLTRILQNALGGNSQTVMICAISPANDNYDETLSTLRYADQAKKIKNKPVVNESQTDKIIRQLKLENQRLKKLLQQKGTDINKQIPNKNDQIKKQQNPVEQKKEQKPIQKKQEKPIQKKQEKPIQKKQEISIQKKQEIPIQKKQEKPIQKKQEKPIQKKQEIPIFKKQQKKKGKKEQSEQQSEEQSDDDDLERLEANLKQLNKRIDDQMKTNQQKRKQQQKLYEQNLKKNQQSVNSNILSITQLQTRQKEGKIPPYFQNISKDFMLHRKLKILLEKDKISIGKLGARPPNDIVFGGRDMQMHHATIQKIESKVFLTPLSSTSHLYRNGEKITKTIQLAHLDRVIFGWNSVYLFKNKDDKRKDQKIQSKDIDWQFCKEQVSKLVDIDDSDTEQGGGCCAIM